MPCLLDCSSHLHISTMFSRRKRKKSSLDYQQSQKRVGNSSQSDVFQKFLHLEMSNHCAICIHHNNGIKRTHKCELTLFLVFVWRHRFRFYYVPVIVTLYVYPYTMYLAIQLTTTSGTASSPRSG